MKLPEKIVNYSENIKSCKTVGAMLSSLSRLLHELNEAPETKKYMIELENQAKEVESKQNNEYRAFYDWLVERVKLLENSKWKHVSKINKSLSEAERILCFRDKIFAISFFNVALGAVKTAACAVAEFGEDALFEGWAEMRLIRVPPSQYIETDFDLTKEGVCEFDDKSQKALSDALGHGVACWRVERLERENDTSPDEFTAYLYKGYIARFQFPPSFYTIFGKDEESDEEQVHHEWLEKVERDPVAQLGLLKCLSEYAAKEFVELTGETTPGSVDEVISGMQSSYKGLFLSSFSRHDPEKYFMSREELLMLVNLFLETVLLEASNAASKSKKPSLGEEESHWRTKEYNADLTVLIPFFEQARREHATPDKVSRAVLIPFVRDIVRKRNIILNNATELLYVEAARRGDFRKKYPRGKASYEGGSS